MIPDIDVKAELEDLEEHFSAFVTLRVGLGTGAATRADTVSAWSVPDHLYHLCLSTDFALRNVQSLVRGKGRLIVLEGEPNELAVQVLTDGTYPRGRSQAPRMVHPPEVIDEALLDQEVELLGQAFARTRAILEEVSAAPGRIPHQHLGALSAAEWLRFSRLHVRHHLAIARDVVAALGT